MKRIYTRKPDKANNATLTAIEKEILHLLRQGHGFKIVGDLTKTPSRKVKYLVKNLRHRFGCQNTTQLVARCIELQLL